MTCSAFVIVVAHVSHSLNMQVCTCEEAAFTQAYAEQTQCEGS